MTTSGFYPSLDGDYDMQIDAVWSVVATMSDTMQEMDTEIDTMVEIAQNASGQVGDYVNDEWIDLAHFASYQNAAHSLATVSMFAAVVESAFRDVCPKINRPVPFEEGRTGGLTADIMVVVNQTGLVFGQIKNGRGRAVGVWYGHPW